MEEPILKKKSIVDEIFKNQLLLTFSTAFLLVFIVIGSSYAIFNSKEETEVTDVIVQSGNLKAILSSTSEIIEMNYTTLGVSDEVGLSYDPYTFTIKNGGDNTIKYYELRIVDEEYENSTLPHKSINFSLSKNGESYTEPQNLGDNRSYIYAGGSLESNESDTFNLKMWVNEEYGEYANNKNLKVSIELTIYSDVPTRNYIIYDTQGGSYISKTNVSSKRVTNQVPLKEGYSFVGWSVSPDGNISYDRNGKYEGNNGTTLYAVWELSVSPPTCTFVLGDSDLVGNCNPTEFYLECVSEHGFSDSEIAVDDLVGLIDDMETDLDGSLTIYPITKTSIHNGYRYNINMMINSFMVTDLQFNISLREGAIVDNYGQRNEYVVGDITFYSDESPC